MPNAVIDLATYLASLEYTFAPADGDHPEWDEPPEPIRWLIPALRLRSA